MSNKVIGDYTAAVTIDGATHFLLIQPGNASVAYKKISRNILLGITGSPVGTSDSQTLTNKIITTPTLTVLDNALTIQDNADPTKQAQFQLSAITAGQTRTYTMPNASVTLASLTGTETLTNKTLTAPVINNGSITGTTITTDAIVGQSSATTGTVYGMSVTTGTIGTSGIANTAVTTAKLATNSVSTAKIINASVTADKLATGAANNSVVTSETTTSVTFVALATAQAISVTVGANGLLLVHVGAQLSNSGANFSSMSFSLSGANTLAASNDRSVTSLDAAGMIAGNTFLLTGLNAGSTTVTALFEVGAGTGTFLRRNIWAIPL